MLFQQVSDGAASDSCTSAESTSFDCRHAARLQPYEATRLCSYANARHYGLAAKLCLYHTPRRGFHCARAPGPNRSGTWRLLVVSSKPSCELNHFVQTARSSGKCTAFRSAKRSACWCGPVVSPLVDKSSSMLRRSVEIGSSPRSAPSPPFLVRTARTRNCDRRRLRRWARPVW